MLVDTLETNGGKIWSEETELNAELSHEGLDQNPAHKVDWRLAPSGASTLAFDDGDEKTLPIAENHADGAAVGKVATPNEDDDELTYSLSGADAADFEIGADSTISVKSGTTLDREAKASYSFTAATTDGEDADGNAEERPAVDGHRRAAGRDARRAVVRGRRGPGRRGRPDRPGGPTRTGTSATWTLGMTDSIPHAETMTSASARANPLGR